MARLLPFDFHFTSFGVAIHWFSIAKPMDSDSKTSARAIENQWIARPKPLDWILLIVIGAVQKW